jgi:hypothetical protein
VQPQAVYEVKAAWVRVPQTAVFGFRSLAIANLLKAVLVLAATPASWRIREAKYKLPIF